MRIRKPLTLILTLSSLLGFISCDSKKDRILKKELRLNLYCEPPTLDSRKVSDSTSVHVLMMLFEGLTRVGMNNQPELALAKQVLMTDHGRTYTFHLKKTRWSNGDPLIASDFIYAWKQILQPKFPAPHAHKLFAIKNAEKIKAGDLPLEKLGVSAPNDYTLIIELNHPIPYFLELLSFPTFFPIPQKIDQEWPDWQQEASSFFINNGPFQLSYWDHENEMRLEKNPLYWDADSVKLDQINLSMIDDTTTELHMFELNELDWAGSPLSNLPSEVIPAFIEKGNITIHPITAVYYYQFNTEHPPFNNPKIRKAFSLAINRQSLIDHILQAKQMPACSLIPPLQTHLKTLTPKKYFVDGDKEKAKKFFEEGLAELQISKENLPTIKLSFNTNREHHKIAQAIQQQWKEVLGIDVELENFEWKVYLSKIGNFDYQIGRMGWVGDFTDPYSFLEPFLPPTRFTSSNTTKWVNSIFTQTVKEAEICQDYHKRLELLQKAEEILIEEMPIIPLYFITYSYIKKPYVKNVYLSPLGTADYKWATIDHPNHYD